MRDSLRVEVADDGVGGADPGAAAGSAASRIASPRSGAASSIDSPAGGGTRVVAEIPLEV